MTCTQGAALACLVLAIAPAAAQQTRLPGAGAAQGRAGDRPPAAGTRQPPAPALPVAVRATLSQTALWVGDRLVYTVEIACAPGAEILDDDLGRDRLRVDGLELVDAGIARDTRPDGRTVYRARYVLASYATDTPVVRIHPLPVRYYVRRGGERAESLRAAEEIEVPAAEVPLRSTLPATGLTGLRDVRPLRLLPPAVSLLRPIALGAILVALVPVAFGVAGTVARARRPSRSRRSSGRSREQHREALARIRALAERPGAAAREEAFDRLGALVREYLAGLGVPAESLTADEVERALAQRPAAASTAGAAALLRECDRARYRHQADIPAGDALERAIEEARALIERRAG